MTADDGRWTNDEGATGISGVGGSRE
jgi:hypothetical protein